MREIAEAMPCCIAAGKSERDMARAMSEESVQLQHRGAGAFNPARPRCLFRALRPEIELSSRLVEGDGGGPYRDHDCLRSWWQNLLRTSPDFSGRSKGCWNSET